MNFLEFLKEDTSIIANRPINRDVETKNKELPELKVQKKKEIKPEPLIDTGLNKNDSPNKGVSIYKDEDSVMSLFYKKKNLVKDDNNMIKQKIDLDYKEFTFKVGDYIKVIRPSVKKTPNYRLCDIYCGYYGMIKKCFKSSYALVTLDAPNNNPTIHIPIEYLEKVYN